MSTTTTTTFKNLIGGEWSPAASGRLFDDTNPADRRDLIGQFQVSSRQDVAHAIELAREAQAKWAALPAPARGKILFRVADLLESRANEFASLLTREEGKTVKESKGEVSRSIDLFRFYGGQGSRINGKTLVSEDPNQLLYTLREPLGIVAVITPWNFPLVIPSWKIAPALVAGNAVVFKPASLTPLIALRLVQLIEEAGLPKGVLSYVTGSGGELGDAMVTDRNISAISFTGSCSVGEGIEAAAKAKSRPRIQLEMGGKNPTVVLADANLDEAVAVVSSAAFGVTGQACTATSRAIVEETIVDRFVEKLSAKAQGIKVGNGLDSETQMGPAVSKAELEKDLDYIKVGVEEGAKLVTGGAALKEGAYEHGNFIAPTVFADVAPDMRIAQEEIFGPILSVISVKSFEEAIDVANGVEFGLSASICTRDLGRAVQFAQKVQAGMVKVNRTTTGAVAYAPFGGVKRSSSNTFREMGEEAMDFYTRIKTIYLGF